MESLRAKLSLYWLARNKPYWIVLLTGLLLAAAFPPLPFGPIIYVAFIPIFILFEKEVVPARVPEDKIFRPFKSLVTVLWRILTLQFIYRKEMRWFKVLSYRRKIISGNAQLFRYTYAIFLLWNGLVCYWLVLTAFSAESVLEGLANATAGIFAIVLNPALMAIPMQFYSRVRLVFHPILAAGCFIVFWITFEYLHFNWDLSWPWLTLGHSLIAWPSLIQYAEFTGVLGISLHILTGNLLLYMAYRWWHYRRRISPVRLGAALLWLALPLLLLGPLTDPDRDIFRSDAIARVRIVQPNVDPAQKYVSLTAQTQIAGFVDQMTATSLDSVDLVILPETAIPMPMNLNRLRSHRVMEPLWALTDSYEVAILTGFEEFRIYPKKPDNAVSARRSVKSYEGSFRYVWIDDYNSAAILRSDRQLSSYQKSRLVPMVERIPLLPWLHRLREHGLDFISGTLNYARPDSSVLLYTTAEVPVGVSICYESAFGDQVREQTLSGAQLLVVITNDGRLMKPSGYLQHAALSVLRAIENRRDLARCANTGQSMFVDAMGQTHQATEWWTQAVIDRDLYLYTGITFYARHGDYLGRIALWLTLLTVLAALGYNIYRKRSATT